MKIHTVLHSLILLPAAVLLIAAPWSATQCHAENPSHAEKAEQSPPLAPIDSYSTEESSDASLDSGMNHGPHAGFMRGKGAVQAELLLGPGSGFRLFFVDAQWIDIPLKDSKLEVLLERQGSAVAPLRCVPKPSTEQTDFFICELPKSTILASGDCIFVRFSQPSGKAHTFNFTFPFTEQEGRKPFPELKEKDAHSPSTAQDAGKEAAASR